MADAARAAGWTADEVPMSDGGEGLLLALGGARYTTLVEGPLGAPVKAEWRMLGRAGRRPAPDRRRRDVTRRGTRPPAPPAPRRPGARHHDRRRPAPPGRPRRGGAPHRDRVRRVGDDRRGARRLRSRGLAGGTARRGARRRVRRHDALQRCRHRVRAAEGRLAGAGGGAQRAPGRGGRPLSTRDGRRRHRGARAAARPAGWPAGWSPSAPGSSPASTSSPDWSAWPAGWSRPISPSPERGTSTPPRSTARCPAACWRWPGPGAPGGTNCPSSASREAWTPPLLAAPPPGLQVVSLTARFGRARARGETASLINQVTAEALARFCP